MWLLWTGLPVCEELTSLTQLNESMKTMSAMTMKSIKIAASILLSLLAYSSNASTLDFEELESGGCAYYGNAGVTSGGFNFVGNPIDANMFGCPAGLVANNTSNALINANHLSIITMTKVGGGAFSLQSFDAGTRFISNGYGVATGVDVLGTYSGGGTVHTTFTFSGESFGHFQLQAFNALVSVKFTAIPNSGSAEFVIDNIVVDDSSQPKTLAENLECGRVGINGLMQPVVIGPAQKNMMLNLVNLASLYKDTPYRSLSLGALNAAVLRVDGCALRGTPDTITTQGATGMDFVTTCPAQAPIYACLKDAQSQLTAP